MVNIVEKKKKRLAVVNKDSFSIFLDIVSNRGINPPLAIVAIDKIRNRVCAFSLFCNVFCYFHHLQIFGKALAYGIFKKFYLLAKNHYLKIEETLGSRAVSKREN